MIPPSGTSAAMTGAYQRRATPQCSWGRNGIRTDWHSPGTANPTHHTPHFHRGGVWDFCFGICKCKLPFPVCIYRFQNLRVSKGALKPLSARGIQWGRKRPVGTRFSCGKSSVLYLPGSAGGSKGMFSYPTDTLRWTQNSRFCEPSGLQIV